MLRILHIENVAIIEKADIEFAAGMNVLTGETGAGKSIVIDALGAVLGGRTSKELVRSGAESALVTAVFSADEAVAWCAENGVQPEEGELFLMRRITQDGKNSCRVCGVPVSVTLLRELGALLLNIHGQNDGQRLLDERYHRDYLDGFGGSGAELPQYRGAYDAYTLALREIEALRIDESEKERRTDTLRYQIAELERADIKPGEITEKTQRRDLLKNAVKLINAINAAYTTLYGGDESDGAAALIGEAEGEIAGVERYSESLPAIAKRLTDLRYLTEDIAEEIGDFRRTLDFSPGELDEIEGRLDALRRLSRKYGGSEEDMLAFLENARAELDNIAYSDEKLAKLRAVLDSREKAVKRAAEKLTEKRKLASGELEMRIKSELSQLSMAGVNFEVCIQPEDSFGPYGADRVSFYMSSNAGEKPGRISHIASGGELARIMLAMKNVLAESDNIPSLVFDEVDTGVSGVAAQRVGEKLADLSRVKQVICITHLPQIAAMADAHFSISKSERDGRTFTSVALLDDYGREREIARLHGGDNITETTIKSAKEQLDAARKYKVKYKSEEN
ncbi:MAG: DNA repair protein RecN [Oscillospiraceae bacterium]